VCSLSPVSPSYCHDGVCVLLAMQSGWTSGFRFLGYPCIWLTDYRCISIGTKRGYSITNCDPFGRVYTMSAWLLLSALTTANRVVLHPANQPFPSTCWLATSTAIVTVTANP
jgi:hypothetical protein